jgi:hypothetical protein
MSEQPRLREFVTAMIMRKRMNRAIRSKLSREIRKGRVVIMKDLARWCSNDTPNNLRTTLRLAGS